MTYPYTRKSKTRFERLLRLRRRQVFEAGEQAEQEIERLLFKRLGRLVGVRRFVAGWVLFVVVLIAGVAVQSRGLGQYYQALTPSSGGTFREGVVGTFTNANPLYSVSRVDASVSKLVFSGLLRFDKDNHLVGDLAESWTSDERGQVYTVKLRGGVKWHDDVSLSVADVLFTYSVIQNPDARSPLFSSWQGVVVSSPAPDIVVFALPTPLAGFQNSLTNGIVPQHILSGVPIGQLRSVGFNTVSPIGTGPFKFSSVEVIGNDTDTREEQVTLRAYEGYHFGRPAIDSYVLRAVRSQDRLAEAFDKRELNAAVGLSPTEVPFNDDTVQTFSVPLTSAVYAFLNNSSPILSDVKVRQALGYATDTETILNKIGYPLIPVTQPFLRGQVGYDRAYEQRTPNQAEAERLLDEAGWIRIAEGATRVKDGVELRLRMYSQSLAEYALVVQNLQDQWQKIGVAVDANLQPESDLQTGVIAQHDYDVLLYGIAIGADSDVFAYWHSSQADPRSPNRLNLSEYKSTVADSALEAGRTRIDPSLRALKYRPFLEAWKNDVPAIGLYQPRFFYVVRGQLEGFTGQPFNNSIDRLNNVIHFMIRQSRSLR